MKESINQRIKSVRIKQGLSQSVFAEKLGIKQASLSDIERGKTEANYNILSELSSQFGVNLNWLVTGLGSYSVEVSELQNLARSMRIDEVNLVNEINANRKRITDYYNRVLDIYELFRIVLDDKDANYGASEQNLKNLVLKEDYVIYNGIEYYETLDYDGKMQYNEELKKAINFLLDSFFNKFRFIYVKLSSPQIFEILKKNIKKTTDKSNNENISE